MNIKVRLLAYTAEPERVVATAARACYREKTPPEIWEEMSDSEKVAKAIYIIKRSGHESPIEHASFTFSLTGVSRSLLAQITRHRLASFSVQSQRYVEFKNGLPSTTPKTIADDANAAPIFHYAVDTAYATYEDLIERGIPPEDARFVLPEAANTNIVLTMNARELRHFFNLRCCQRAQWEIRQVAEEMYKQVFPIAPHIFDDAGPSCVTTGRCPEGKKSCGKINEVRELYKKIVEGAAE